MLYRELWLEINTKAPPQGHFLPSTPSGRFLMRRIFDNLMSLERTRGCSGAICAGLDAGTFWSQLFAVGSADTMFSIARITTQYKRNTCIFAMQKLK